MHACMGVWAGPPRGHTDVRCNRHAVHTDARPRIVSRLYATTKVQPALRENLGQVPAWPDWLSSLHTQPD